MTQERPHQIIRELREERDLLSQLIAILEGVQTGKPRWGRPPKYLARESANPRRKRK